MSIRDRVQSAVWPALFGLYAAHQLAYIHHHDGHIHGYLDRMGPGLLVAVSAGWILSTRRSRIRFSDVLAIQLTLFSVMELSERVFASDFTMLAPVLIGAVLVPVAAVAVTVIDHLSAHVVWSTCRVHLLSRADLPQVFAAGAVSVLSVVSPGT